MRRQRELLGLDRSGLYYEPVGSDAQEISLCHRLDELYTAHPFYGVRRMTEVLRREGATVNPKRVRRSLRQMGLLAVYPKPRLSLSAFGQRVFPYLLRGLAIERPHQVRAIDITNGRLRSSFAFLVALLEWFSRYVMAWQLEPSLATLHCLRVLEAAMARAGCSAQIVNSDRGSQPSPVVHEAKLPWARRSSLPIRLSYKRSPAARDSRVDLHPSCLPAYC
ncbi:IS3 family transposase [Verrucomicrobium sp. 3C]|uniref:IS3 family transposase n=1 Tax=Verrucomicrobium sp. 3C TaxID=1134055 RepID=UPI00035C6DE0|nr:IS3 family transposase [Verrucomicrobium sp. 3C]